MLLWSTVFNPNTVYAKKIISFLKNVRFSGKGRHARHRNTLRKFVKR